MNESSKTLVAFTNFFSGIYFPYILNDTNVDL